MTVPFPALPADWEPTRASLHAYSKALGTLPQTHIEHHPKWWHLSLRVNAHGLGISEITLADGAVLNGWLDLGTHEVVLESSGGVRTGIDMTAGMTGTEMADAVIAAAADFGLEGEYVRKDFESDEARSYDRSVASTYLAPLTNTAAVLEAQRGSIDGDVGPVQFWPHGFDLAFEWFGTKKTEYDGTMLPSQLNFGFYSTGDPYFYSNPWPFDESLLEGPPPGAGEWISEPFQGSRLTYDKVADRPDGSDVLAAYGRAVFEAASPTLMA